MNVHGEDRALADRLLSTAVELATEHEARAVLVHAEALPDPRSLQELRLAHPAVRFVVAGRSEDELAAFGGGDVEVLHVPAVRLSRMGQVKMAILHGLSRRILQRGDVVVAVTGVSGSASLDTLTVTQVGTELELFSADQDVLPQGVEADVFERVIDIAVALGNVGREGKPVGATFVLGSPAEIGQHSHQMVLNPFRGHPESERSVLDPALEETLREYSTLDGAIVIRGDGLLESAGTYLVTTGAATGLPSGLGARHHSAAAVTAATEAIAITVSESTGNVMVFRRGRPVIEIERPRAGGRPTASA